MINFPASYENRNSISYGNPYGYAAGQSASATDAARQDMKDDRLRQEPAGKENAKGERTGAKTPREEAEEKAERERKGIKTPREEAEEKAERERRGIKTPREEAEEKAERERKGIKTPREKEQEKAEKERKGIQDPSQECQTCKNRRYKDGSDEMVSFKTPTHISPQSAASAVRAHEQEHVANAYSKAARKNGKVLSATVSIHTAICPECGRTYVAGGTTHTQIKYFNEENPYQKGLKSADRSKYSGMHLNYGV